MIGNKYLIVDLCSISRIVIFNRSQRLTQISFWKIILQIVTNTADIGNIHIRVHVLINKRYQCIVISDISVCARWTKI